MAANEQYKSKNNKIQAITELTVQVSFFFVFWFFFTNFIQDWIGINEKARTYVKLHKFINL